MTEDEKQLASALLKCSFLPGSYDKIFVRQLPNWESREMSDLGQKKLIELFHKYRRQITGYQKICDTNKLLKPI